MARFSKAHLALATSVTIEKLEPRTLLSAPANNNFANPSLLTGDDIHISGSNVGATLEPGEPQHAGSTGGHSVWYAWTAPRAGVIDINTAGSNFNTVLAVYTGQGLQTLLSVASNNNMAGATDGSSRVAFSAAAGTTYWVAVDGWGGDSGAIMLNLQYGQVVSFADSHLEAAVCARLGIADRNIIVSDMAALTYFAASQQIQSLQGLQYATRLEWLDLPQNQISSVSPLAGLTSLKHLGLAQNSISDVSPLAGLTGLQNLDLSQNRIGDVSSLAGLTSLTDLSLSQNGIANIAPLRTLTSIERLYLAQNTISDISPLADLASLRYLDLVQNSIGNIAPLAGLTNLTDLYLSENGISSIASLAGLTGLEYLYLSHNSISSIAPLAGLTTIWDLDLAYNNISDIAPLAGFAGLERLGLSENNISDITPLAGLTAIWDLDLSHNNISSLAPLAEMTCLEALDASGNRISNIAPLAGLTGLLNLNLSQNSIGDISTLGNLTQLALVDLTNNRLNVSAGSAAMAVISALQAQGTSISYLPQDDSTDELLLSSDSVPENRPAGTVVGTLSFASTPATYSLPAGISDNSTFTLVGSELRLVSSLNYEAKSQYALTIQATFPGGLTVTKQFTILVINAAEVVPTLTGITSDTGSSATDRLTSDRTVLLSGTSEPGMTITLYRNGTLLGSTLASSTGAWTYDHTGTSLADGQYSFTATASDTLGHTTAASAALIVRIDATAPAAPTLTINSGQLQRSMVKRLDVTFAEPVTLATGALTLKLKSGAAIPNTTVTATNPSGDQKVYVLTFSGSAVIGGSLADGVYDVVVTATGVQDLAGNALTANYTQRFHRLFGDSDGNRIINSLDYARLKQTFGRAPTDPLFNSAFDYEGNTLINALDLARFRQRYGMSFSY